MLSELKLTFILKDRIVLTSITTLFFPQFNGNLCILGQIQHDAVHVHLYIPPIPTITTGLLFLIAPNYKQHQVCMDGMQYRATGVMKLSAQTFSGLIHNFNSLVPRPSQLLMLHAKKAGRQPGGDVMS